MQSANPFPMRLVFARCATHDEAMKAEHAAMVALEAHHIHGEWFSVSRADAILAVERALPVDRES